MGVQNVLIKKFSHLFQKTQHIISGLIELGFNIIEMWECEFQKCYSLTQKEILQKKKEF